MNLSSLLHGGGKRRRSDESWTALERKVAAAERAAAPIKGLTQCGCRTGKHTNWRAYTDKGFACPWCQLDELMPVPRPALAGAPQVPAPADDPDSAFATQAPTPAEDPRLRIVADTPAAPAVSEAADVNAKTQQVPVAALREAVGEGDTMQLPAVPDQRAVRPVVAVTADHLEPARAKVPPKPARPPRHTFSDPDAVVGFATADLKQQVDAAAILAGRSIPVRLAKIPTPRRADQRPA